MRSDQSHDHYFDQQKKLPGPGTYGHHDLVGRQNSNSQFVTSPRSSVPKANDRFRAPTEMVKSPSPDTYYPLQQIGFDVSSRQPRAPRTKFGQDKSDILALQYSMKRAKENPGPGSHETFSEFHSGQM